MAGVAPMPSVAIAAPAVPGSEPGSGSVSGAGSMPSAAPDSPPAVHRFERRAMGSALRLTIVGAPPARAEAAWRLVSDEFEAAEATMSRFRESSDLTALNRAAGSGRASAVDRRLVRALVAADRAGRLTGGRFDPRILADLERLGYRGADLGGIPATRSIVPRWLSLDPRASSAAVECPADLGGIGKGLALRWAWRALERSGVAAVETGTGASSGALLEAGGDLVAGGPAPGGGPWIVGVEDPRGGPEPLAAIAAPSGAVATSSVRVHRWRTDDDRPVHHLLDPRTGEPGGAGLLAVTVASPDPAWAEVWSKTLFLAGADGIVELARSRGLAAWWILDDGRLEMTAAARARTTWVAAEA